MVRSLLSASSCGDALEIIGLRESSVQISFLAPANWTLKLLPLETGIVISEVSKKDSKEVKHGAVNVVQGVAVYKINPGKNNWFKKFRIWSEIWKLKKFIIKICSFKLNIK